MQNPRARVQKSKSSQQSLVIIVLIVLTVAAIVLNVVLGLFYGSSSLSSVTLTGNVNLEAYIEGRQEMIFTANDLQPGNVIPKTLKIKTNENTEQCYVRIKTSFKVNNVSNANIFMTLNSGDTNWALQSGVTSSGWFFYKYSMGQDELHFVHMLFNVSPDIPEGYVGQKLTAHVEVEVLSVQEGYIDWDNLPLGWPEVR